MQRNSENILYMRQKACEVSVVWVGRDVIKLRELFKFLNYENQLHE